MVAIYLMAVVGFIDLCFDASSLAAFGDTCVLPIRAGIAASGCARKRKGERYPLPPILPPFYHQANVVPDLPSLALLRSARNPSPTSLMPAISILPLQLSPFQYLFWPLNTFCIVKLYSFY